MSEVIFARDDQWLPRVVREEGGLRAAVVGGADALHGPRVFSFPIEEAHVAALRVDLARHLILDSALRPLCDDAGTRGTLDEHAAVALLDPILLASPDDVDAFLRHTRWDRSALVARGANRALLDRGRVMAALGAADGRADWSRAQQDTADRDRSRRGVTLSALDAAVLRFTGQYLHAATVPRRDPAAVDAGLLPQVQQVIATAEQACAGLGIARDPRRGPRGTDKADWRRLESIVQQALGAAHPRLGADAVGSVSFLICSEAAGRALLGPYDTDDSAAPAPRRTLTFTDDKQVVSTWQPGESPSAAEAFWAFVAERVDGHNEVFSLEDEAAGDGVQLHFYADSIARVTTVGPAADGQPEYRVEYALVDDLAHYRRMVRAYVTGGFAALADLGHWYGDAAEFEQARKKGRSRQG